MSKFSKKASDRSGGGGSNVDWDAYNDHLLEQIGEEEENRIAVVSGLIDLGIQDRPDYVEEYKGTKAQEAALKSGKSRLDEDEENIITPLKPTEQIAIMADFPEIMINYGKFFSKDGEDDWKPYRHLITGEWWDKSARKMLAKGVSLSCKPDDKSESGWAYDRKSNISKLAVATGVVAKAPVDQNFDIGELLGGVFTMDVSAEESKDGKHINVKVKNISKKHEKIPVPDHDIEPFGVMFDGDNDEESLKQLRASVKNTLERAQGWETSGLKAELDALATKTKEDNKDENGMPDLDDMEDEDIFDLAEELGMKVTRRTKISDAVSFVEDYYSKKDESEDTEEEDEEEPESKPKRTSRKSNTKPKGNTKKPVEDDTEEEEAPFDTDEESDDEEDDEVPY